MYLEFKHLKQEENTNKQEPINSEIDFDGIKIIKMKTSRKVGTRLRFKVLREIISLVSIVGKIPKMIVLN